MPVQVTKQSRTLVELPMMIFLRLADGDGKMTAQEMERFDALLHTPSWCRSSLLQRSLAKTEAEKTDLWRQYVDGRLATNIGDVTASLDVVLSSISPQDRPDLERDLLYFARELRKAAHSAAGFLRTDAEAEAIFSALSDLIKRPSARERRSPQTEARAELSPTRESANALLLSSPSPDLFWQGGKLPLRCIHVVDETHDTKTFHFVVEPPKLFRYYPGQFLTFDIPVDGQTIRRSYTISSSPSRPYSIAVTVKRAEDGRASNWLHSNLRVDSYLFADGPHGKFTCIDGDEGSYLFLSAGSGITPVMSMARWLCDTRPSADIRFVHAARTPGDLLFEHELRMMERQFQLFRYEVVCSRTGAESGWTGRSGRITSELLAEIVPDLKSRAVYLCGPVPFMQVVRDSLTQLSFDMTRFRQESFGGVPRDTKVPETEANTPAKVVFSASAVEVDCRGSDYLLDIALEHGVQAAFSCRAGQCGSCKVALLEGSVVHDCADALTQDDVNVVLACQARPVGRVVLDL